MRVYSFKVHVHTMNSKTGLGAAAAAARAGMNSKGGLGAAAAAARAGVSTFGRLRSKAIEGYVEPGVYKIIEWHEIDAATKEWMERQLPNEKQRYVYIIQHGYSTECHSRLEADLTGGSGIFSRDVLPKKVEKVKNLLIAEFLLETNNLKEGDMFTPDDIAFHLGLSESPESFIDYSIYPKAEGVALKALEMELRNPYYEKFEGGSKKQYLDELRNNLKEIFEEVKQPMKEGSQKQKTTGSMTPDWNTYL